MCKIQLQNKKKWCKKCLEITGLLILKAEPENVNFEPLLSESCAKFWTHFHSADKIQNARRKILKHSKTKYILLMQRSSFGLCEVIVIRWSSTTGTGEKLSRRRRRNTFLKDCSEWSGLWSSDLVSYGLWYFQSFVYFRNDCRTALTEWKWFE